jgi:hypothetical protein
MRWSAGVFVVLAGLVLAVSPGCRKVPTENNDRNRAPDTYLSSAPVDSIASGGLSRVPHRFRAQWGGSDVDGEVAGFFVAVTETTVDVSNGRPFRLPPPRPSQYVFTTAHESLFVFPVLEGRGTDREHGLYVFAVDNEGKVDPTPAITHFVARDPHLPGVRFSNATSFGTVYESNGVGGVTPVPFEEPLFDTAELPQHVPRDTIPSGGYVKFDWQGFDDDFASSVQGYLYKLTETEFVRVDSTVKHAEYGPGTANPAELPIGLNVFRIRAIDEAGGTTQPDSLRRFYVNFSPDTWLAGPDPNDPALQGHTFTDSLGTYFETIQSGNNWGQMVDFPGNPMTDTLQLRPAERAVTDGVKGRPKTIIEQRVLLDRTVRNYIRSENDTIAYGSLITARFGGSDIDSPYRVRGGDPDSMSRIYQSGPANGSPVAFQARLVTVFSQGGSEEPPFSTPFPNVDPLDPLVNRTVLFTSEYVDGTGKSYLQFRAVDGDRVGDIRIGDVIRDAESFELTGNPLRSKIFTIYTNYQPGMMVESPAVGTVLNPAGDRFNISIRCMDPDPDPWVVSNPPIGGSPYVPYYFIIRARIYSASETPGPEQEWQDPLRGKYAPESPTAVGSQFPYTAPISLEIVVPGDLPTGPAIVEIEVVDNVERIKGRIIRVQVPVYWRVGP